MSQIPVEVTAALQKLRDAEYRAVAAGVEARESLHALWEKHKAGLTPRYPKWDKLQ